MEIQRITTNDVRRIEGQEGLILQGCGGSLQQWVDGVNQMLTENGCLLEGTTFQKVSSFELNGCTCLLFHFTDDVKMDIGKLAKWRIDSQVMEAHAGELGRRDIYLRYIAERPGVEKLGKHGLFTDEGIPIVLEQVANEMAECKSNIWTHIISLRREDAQRLGYDSAEDWMNLLRSKRNVIAQQMGIKPENFRWYAAFHDAGHHPHVHIMAYSIDPKEAYLTEKGIEAIKAELAKEIFRQDQISIYQKQTQYRDQLRSQGRESVTEIVKQINSRGLHNDRIEVLLVQLSEKLSRTSGKKVYGYLKPEVKAIVNEIVVELAKDSRIKKLYNLWYEQREDVLRTYTNHFPERIPLERNPEFKSIRNAVIQEAMNLLNTKRYYENNYGIRVNFGEKQSKKKAPPGKPPDEQKVQEAPDMSRITPRIPVASSPSIPQAAPVLRVDSAVTAQASLRLLQNLSKLIEQKYQQEQQEERPVMDRKQRQEIAEKKQALGLRD